MIKGAIFDVDGTLMDSMWVWEAAFRDFANAHGLGSDSHVGHTLIQLSLGEGATYLKQEFNLPGTPLTIQEEIAGYAARRYLTDVTLKPNVHEFLEALSASNIPMTIVTSGEQQLVEQTLDHLNARHYFQHIYAATNEGISKREPTLWLTAAQLMGTEPADTWVFEDAAYAIKVTKALGFHTVGIADSHSASHQEDVQQLADLYWEQYPHSIPEEMR